MNPALRRLTSVCHSFCFIGSHLMGTSVWARRGKQMGGGPKSSADVFLFKLYGGVHLKHLQGTDILYKMYFWLCQVSASAARFSVNSRVLTNSTSALTFSLKQKKKTLIIKHQCQKDSLRPPCTTFSNKRGLTPWRLNLFVIIHIKNSYLFFYFQADAK